MELSRLNRVCCYEARRTWICLSMPSLVPGMLLEITDASGPELMANPQGFEDGVPGDPKFSFP